MKCVCVLDGMRGLCKMRTGSKLIVELTLVKVSLVMPINFYCSLLIHVHYFYLIIAKAFYTCKFQYVPLTKFSTHPFLLEF